MFANAVNRKWKSRKALWSLRTVYQTTFRIQKLATINSLWLVNSIRPNQEPRLLLEWDLLLLPRILKNLHTQGMICLAWTNPFRIFLFIINPWWKWLYLAKRASIAQAKKGITLQESDDISIIFFDIFRDITTLGDLGVLGGGWVCNVSSMPKPPIVRIDQQT